MLVDLFIYSFRNLKNRKLRTWLTLLGIVIGIASVIALIGLGNGLRAAITGQFGSVSADLLTVQAGGISFGGPPGSGVVNPLKDSYVEDIESISYVEFAIARILETGTLEFNDIQQVGIAVSMPDGRPRDQVKDIFGLDAEFGRELKDGDGKKVFLGHNFMKKDNGFDKSIIPGENVKLNDESFEVVGIMESKGSFMFDGAVFVNEDVLRDLTDNQDDVDVIAIKVKNMNDVDKAKVAVEKYLRKERNVKEGEEDFTVETAQAVLDTINSVLGGVQAFIIIIASISMFVGAVGIINTMFTSVMERRKEIGIMKSIGAKNSDIFYLFLIESGLLGVVGGILGVIFGSLVAIAGTTGLGTALGINVSPSISITMIIIALISSFILGAISGIIPAMQAAKMNPVDALRS